LTCWVSGAEYRTGHTLSGCTYLLQIIDHFSMI
jgi:hypothetical protein